MDSNMDKNSVENRLSSLEEQVREILGTLQNGDLNLPKVKDWRKSLGMFDRDTLMQEIDVEGQKIRQEDREQLANDNS